MNMTGRVRRRLVAATMAVALGALGTAQPVWATEKSSGGAPAQATQAAPDAHLMFFSWPNLIINVATAYLAGGSSSSDLRSAINQIIAAVEASKIEILNHIDALAGADIQACARQHTIEFADIENMSNTVRQLWAQDATSCAALATSYLNAVDSQQAADTISRLVPEIYAIAISARARAGFTIDLLTQDLIRTTETITVKLRPDCTTETLRWWDTSENAWYFEVHYTCTAYDGTRVSRYEAWLHAPDSGWLISEPLDRAWIEAEAAKNTSWPQAVEALPRLRTIPT